MFDRATFRGGTSLAFDSATFQSSLATLRFATVDASSYLDFRHVQCRARSGISLGGSALHPDASISFESASLWEARYVSFALIGDIPEVSGPWEGVHPPRTYSGMEPFPDLTQLRWIESEGSS